MWFIFVFMILPAVLSDCSKVKYADDAYEDVLHRFFDSKLVLIAYNDDTQLKAIAPGIFIDFHLILTSYNPFRLDRIRWYGLDRYKVCVLKSRTVNTAGSYVFQASTHNIVCARQIIPFPEANYTRKIFHGYNLTHSPLHDMMVVRITPRDYAVRSWYNWIYGAAIGFSFPIPVHIAKQFYELRGRYLTIASLGFRDYEHIRESKTLLSRTYSTELVMADCDEWLPRWWGYFICIQNVDNFKGIGSGALLVHENALFGIGSFMLNKRNNSVLVFTDVRPYYRMFGTACHEYEASYITLRDGYDRDEFWYYAHHRRIEDFATLFTKVPY